MIERTISELTKGLRQKEFSATELTTAYLARIKTTNADYNSFSFIDEDGALKAAREADKDIASGAKTLTGIPASIKDMIVTKGLPSAAGSKILKNFIPPYDSTVVSKLKHSGGVILGKTNQDEFGMGSSNENSIYGPVKNPYDPNRVPGGSSGGSAVSVALNQAAFSLGTDTGGSVRQPASYCGVVGLKPTYGRISRYGVIAFASSLDQVGIFAKTAEDTATILSVLSGFDPLDSTSFKTEVPNYLGELNTSVKGLRLGVPKEYLSLGANQEVLDSFNSALKMFESLGATVVDISLPHTEYALSVYYILVPAEASSNLSRYDGVRYGVRSENYSNLKELYTRSRTEGFGHEVKRRIMIGTYVLSSGYYDAYYKKAQQVRTLIIKDFKDVFGSRCDLILSPTAPTVAFKHGAYKENPIDMYRADVFTTPASLAGLPALSLPIRKNPLPIGLQIIGPAFGESRILSAAHALEKGLGL